MNSEDREAGEGARDRVGPSHGARGRVRGEAALGTGRGPEGRLRLRDEILQMMYWMRGEGLAEEVGPDDLTPFLGAGTEAEALDAELASMVGAGLLDEVGGGRYALTAQGLLEGGRRFSDEFEGLTEQAHGECSDPDCDCDTDPQAALECLSERHGLPHGG